MFTPLKIRNTSNCLPTPWHPSVVYVPDGWNGHKYWMAQTPFPPTYIPPYSDRYELPCIHYSDDGLDFKPINANPIVDLTEDEIVAHYYYSDPHLIFRNGHLEIFFRFTFLKDKQYLGNKTLLLRSISIDGFNWDKPIVVADLRNEDDIKIWGEQIISQSLCWDGGKYQCWYVDKSSFLPNRNIRYSTSLDGVVWEDNTLCTLQGPSIDPWHIDVQFFDGKYQMIVYDMHKLLWYESSDGLDFNFVSQILSPSSNYDDFYADGLYRACSIKTDKGIFVYFSAKNNDKSYVGCLKTTDRVSFTPVNGYAGIEWRWIKLRLKIKSFYKHIKKTTKKFIMSCICKLK